ncbi:hypothetical protein SUGI_0394210, partial [Cryptomeria japonica]
MDGSGKGEGKCIEDDWSNIFKLNPAFDPVLEYKCCPAPPPSMENNHLFDGVIGPSSPQALQLCTEGLGFESSDETESPKIQAFNGDDKAEENFVEETEQGTPRRHRAPCNKFPPPLPSIARNGHAGFFFKSCKKDGRFLLQEVKLPPHEVLHAWRGEGRLQLHLAHNDDFDDG